MLRSLQRHTARVSYSRVGSLTQSAFGSLRPALCGCVPSAMVLLASKQMGYREFHLPLTSRQSSFMLIILRLYKQTLGCCSGLKNGCNVDNNKIIKNNINNYMNEQPIKRKFTHYPKDFLPPTQSLQPQKRFTFNQDYQIDLNSIRKYQDSIEELQEQIPAHAQSLTHNLNPQKLVVSCNEHEQQHPLDHHLKSKKPDLNADLLKKPRFSVNNKEEISQGDDHLLENSASPGSIRRQLENRQAPLPNEDPCRIELVRKIDSKMSKVPNQCIKYKSSAEFSSKRWINSDKDIIDKMKVSRSKLDQFPKVQNKSLNQSTSHINAKQSYDSFRKRQQSLGPNLGQMNNLLVSIRKKEDAIPTQLPRFEPSIIQKLKDEINQLTKTKKGISKKQDSSEQSSNQNQQITNHQEYPQQSRKNKSRLSHKTHNQLREEQLPELIVSYRSSLSYLKDLYVKAEQLSAYHLMVKIPKLFTENLIFKSQQREQLYETARSIFQELKIPHQNLVIKRYTNCTMIIARNVCLIWHFDGKRFLGGWQSDYLDEGFKHGLGLQWEPRKYVYYGQFVKNKKHGLGIYKDKHNISYIGYWQKGARADPPQNSAWNQYEEDQQEDMYNSGEKLNHAYQYL